MTRNISIDAKWVLQIVGLDTGCIAYTGAELSEHEARDLARTLSVGGVYVGMKNDEAEFGYENGIEDRWVPAFTVAPGPSTEESAQ
jgi:hypothetical protein